MRANCAHLYTATPCLPVVTIVLSACHIVKLMVVDFFETRWQERTDIN